MTWLSAELLLQSFPVGRVLKLTISRCYTLYKYGDSKLINETLHLVDSSFDIIGMSYL
jgi:hypothetical protein